MLRCVDFKDLLNGYLIARQFTPQTFAIAAGYKGSGYVTNVLKGDRVPDSKIVQKWAKLLRLSREDGNEFFDVARLTRVKLDADAAAVVEQLERDIVEARAKERLTRQLFFELCSLCQDRGLQLPEKILQFRQVSGEGSDAGS